MCNNKMNQTGSSDVHHAGYHSLTSRALFSFCRRYTDKSPTNCAESEKRCRPDPRATVEWSQEVSWLKEGNRGHVSLQILLRHTVTHVLQRYTSCWQSGPLLTLLRPLIQFLAPTWWKSSSHVLGSLRNPVERSSAHFYLRFPRLRDFEHGLLEKNQLTRRNASTM